MSTIRLYPAQVRASGRARAFEAARPLQAKVLLGAKTLVPRGSHTNGLGKRVSGPTLLASLHSKQDLRSQTEVAFDIGSPLNYAATAHQGSKRHDIPGNPLLAFYWPRARFFGGQRRRGPAPLWISEKVDHPGNKRPVRYLTTPLEQFGRAAGFIVSKQPVSRGFLP